LIPSLIKSDMIYKLNILHHIENEKQVLISGFTRKGLYSAVLLGTKGKINKETIA